MRTIFATICSRSCSSAIFRTTTSRPQRRNSGAISLPRTASATAGNRPCLSGTSRTPTMCRPSRSRCGSRRTTLLGPSTSGPASSGYPASRMTICSIHSRRVSNTSKTSHSRARSRGCSRRSISAPTSSAKPIWIETRSSARSSPRSPRVWLSSPRTATPSATPMNTSSASSPLARARRQVSSTRRSESRTSSRRSSPSTARSRGPASGTTWPTLWTSPVARARCCSMCASAWGRAVSERYTDRRRTSLPTTSRG